MPDNQANGRSVRVPRSAITRVIEAFMGEVHEVAGTFFDAVGGIQCMRKQIEDGQQQFLRRPDFDIPVRSMEYLDTLAFHHGRILPDGQNVDADHTSTQGEFKARTADGGRDMRLLANMALVAIYQLWEDHYRRAIADAMGLQPNEVRSPIMGDIRLLRNSIIHHRGLALSETARCEQLRWFKEGDEINIAPTMFRQITTAVYAYLDDLASRSE